MQNDKSFIYIDVSLSKIVVGFAGLSVAVAAFHYLSTKKNKQVCLTSEEIVAGESKIGTVKSKILKVVLSDKNNIFNIPASSNDLIREEKFRETNNIEKELGFAKLCEEHSRQLADVVELGEITFTHVVYYVFFAA